MHEFHIAVIAAVLILGGGGMMVQADSSLTRANAAQPGQAELSQLRKQAAQRQRRIIYNDDGCHVRPYPTPEQFLGLRLKQVADTQVDSVFYCTGVTGMFYGHRPRVGEFFGKYVTDESPAYFRTIRDSIHALAALDTDQLTLATDFCHDNGMEIFFSLRMNDIHEAFPQWPGLLSDFKRNHPEYRFGEPGDFHLYPRSDVRSTAWPALDYAVPQVRQYVLGIFRDVCEGYDVDGIELDWWRSPIAFRPTLTLEPVTPEQIAIMSDWMRQVRKMTEEIAAERGRPLLIAVRLPMSVSRCRELGFDIDSWLRDDLVDLVVVGGGYAPMAIAPEIHDMAEFTHQYDVPLYACISASGMRQEYGSVEAWRGAAMNIWHAGADGIYTFNFFPAQRDPRLSELGSPQTLKGLNKIYGVDRIVPETFEGDLRPGLVVPNRLPIDLEPDRWVAVRMPVGEDIVANAPPGNTTNTRLRLQISKLAQGDEVAVRLNGQTLPAAVPDKPLSAEPSAVWFELQPAPQLFQAGQNLIEVQLTTPRALEAPATLEALYLTVAYE